MNEILEKNYELLKKQYYLIEKSLKKLENKMDIISESDLEDFEVLCSRYSRGVDFLIRKVFRSIDLYELENSGNLIDIVNRAEKRGLIDSVDKIREMKDLRNFIVYEYVEDNLVNVFDLTKEYLKKLLEYMQHTISYLEKLKDEK